MPHRPVVTVVIVGGGASGVLVARHLWARLGEGVRLVIVDRTGIFGRGVAYGSPEDGHLLNVYAAAMGADPEHPEGFWRWLERTGWSRDPRIAGPEDFAPRHVYGDYLESLIEPLIAAGVLECRAGTCVAAEATGAGVRVRLADGAEIAGDALMLATGNEPPVADPAAECGWERHRSRIAPDALVLIKGTGLTMVDHIVSLARCGHRGRVVAVSRRGLTPRPHDATVAPTKLPEPPPTGQPVSATLAWVRRRIAVHAAEGGDWRAVIDALRPHLHRIWRGWSLAERRRFVRHLRPYWDVHRHRTAPRPYALVEDGLRTGRLEVVAARLLEIGDDDAGITVRMRRRGASAEETLTVDHVFDCSGVSADPTRSRNPLVRALLDAGLARADASGMGMEVAESGQLVAADGSSHARIFAIGPVARAAFWEITAIAEIRDQAVAIAERIAASVALASKAAE